jgi:hypothetical protein
LLQRFFWNLVDSKEWRYNENSSTRKLVHRTFVDLINMAKIRRPCVLDFVRALLYAQMGLFI